MGRNHFTRPNKLTMKNLPYGEANRVVAHKERRRVGNHRNFPLIPHPLEKVYWRYTLESATCLKL